MKFSLAQWFWLGILRLILIKVRRIQARLEGDTMTTSLCGDEMTRSSFAPIAGRSRPGAALCALFATAVWLSPFSIANARADEADQANPADQGTEVAQYYTIEVPSRRDMVERGKTVVQRPRPDYLPLGVRAGSFIIRPRMAVRETFTDNVFSSNSSEKSDFITRFVPSVSVSSDWNNHSLSAFANANIGRHRKYSFEDYEDYTLGASGRLDVRRSTNIRARVETRRRHETRDSPDDTGGRTPTEFDVHIGQIEGYQRFNRLNFTLGVGVERYDFHNSTTRDRDEYTTFLRTGYEVIQNYEAFLRLAYNIRDYDAGSDSNGLDHDSHGYEAVAGIKIDFGGITFGDFFLGYRKQEYDASVFNSSDGPVIGAEITWNVTPLTTLVGTITGQLQESTLSDGMGGFASGSFNTTFGLNAQHELLRNLILQGDLRYSNNDYKGIDRTDDTYFAGLSANYLMNRNFYLQGGLGHRQRESNISGSGYKENVVYLRLQAQY